MFYLKRSLPRLFCVILFVLSLPAYIAQADVAPIQTVVLIGDNANLPDADVLTAAMLVYDELRKHGISISEPVWEAPASANVYRIVMRPLGTKIFVRLSEEKPA